MPRCRCRWPQGAQYQKPRKIPLRIEPKTYFGETAWGVWAASPPACPTSLFPLLLLLVDPAPLLFSASIPLQSANERTFLAWLGMATTLGTVSTAIAGFVVDGRQRPGGISQGTVELITLTLLPVSVAMIAYALFTFYWRSEFIRRKQVGFFDDKVGARAGKAGLRGGAPRPASHPCRENGLHWQRSIAVRPRSRSCCQGSQQGEGCWSKEARYPLGGTLHVPRISRVLVLPRHVRAWLRRWDPSLWQSWSWPPSPSSCWRPSRTSS